MSPYGPLAIDLISTIISFAALHALPSLSGTNREVASMALQATRSRLRNTATQAVLINPPDDLVTGMGVTAVCKLIKAHDDIQSFLIDQCAATSPEYVSRDFSCFCCKDEEGNPSKLRTKGLIKNAGCLPMQTFVCRSGNGGGCRTRYTMYFQSCQNPRRCPDQGLALRLAPTRGRRCARCRLKEESKYCRFVKNDDFGHNDDDVFCCDCLVRDHNEECECNQCMIDAMLYGGGDGY